MTIRHEKTLQNILTCSTALKSLASKAEQLIQLNAKVAEIIPQQFKHDVSVISYQDGALTLGASNPAVATALKFQTNSLLKLIQQMRDFPVDCQTIKVIVAQQ